MACSGPLNSVRYVINRQCNDKYQLTQQFAKYKFDATPSFYKKDLFAHFGCVNAIEFSNEGQLLVSGGDDRRVLVWRVEDAIHGRYKPSIMQAQHVSNIFCLGYNSDNSKIFSAGNDDQVIIHDTRNGHPTDYFLHEKPVYGLSIDPLNDNVFASACDDGRILVFDIREPATSESVCMASYPSAFHGVMFNPVEPRLMATANAKEGVGLWDVRKPQEEVVRYGGEIASQSCMSVRFNQRGSHILALRRRLPPVLYHTHSARMCAQFDHPGYYNSCTMKSCSFAGAQDEYVLSGSDDFNLYMWKIPNTQKSGQWVSSAHMILKGHRSIVNQVRFNPTNNIIASSGVEKIIKFWSPFQLPGSIGENTEQHEESETRKVFTHEEYISLVVQSGQFMSHDYSHQSTQEDPRMMAFFDSLVQREIEGWSSEAEESVHSTVSLQMAEAREETLTPIDPNWTPSTTSDSEAETASTDFVRALQAKHAPRTNHNNNNTSSAPEASGSSTNNMETNLIAQLIAKKRAQLMKLAHVKVKSDQKASRNRKRAKKLKKSRLLDTSYTTSSSSSSDSSSDSSSEDDWSYRPGISTINFSNKNGKTKSNGLNGVKRLADSSSSADNDDNSHTSSQNRHKRFKATASCSSGYASTKDNYKHCKSKNKTKNQCIPSLEQPSTSTTSVPNHNALDSTTNFSSAEESSSEDWDKPGQSSKRKKYSGTPDSGIDLTASQANGSMSRPADSNDECEKLPKFTKASKNRFKRNYRSRVANRAATDSDSD